MMNGEGKRPKVEGVKKSCGWCNPSKLNIVWVIVKDEREKDYFVPDKAAYCPFCGNELLRGHHG